MRIEKLNGCTVELYDSVDNLPATNYINHTRLAMLDAGIGSDLDAISQHWQHIVRLSEKGDKDGLQKVLLNYRQALQFVISNTSPEMASFVSFIYKIDGVEVTDFSDDNAKAIIEKLSRKGLTVGRVRSFMEWVKKKSNRN